jgi:signal peptidase II
MGLGFSVAVVVAVLDQLTKLWVIHFFEARPVGAPVAAIAPFFNLVLTGNRGMSFGLFNNDAAANTAVFTALAAIIVVGLALWLRRAETPVLRAGIGLVIGGAVGNVIDRVIRGAVVDFLDFYIGDWHWFAFNVADAAICLGVVALLLDGLLGRGRSA